MYQDLWTEVAEIERADSVLTVLSILRSGHTDEHVAHKAAASKWAHRV